MASRTSLGGPLRLADEGILTTNARTQLTEHPGASTITGDPGPGDIAVGTVHVHYRIPEDVEGVPIVMIHGACASGTSWETTPDGREGWATWFVRCGHPVYVIDQAGRGRSGFDPSAINAARSGARTAEELPNVFLATKQRTWVNSRIGPQYPIAFPGVRFPVGSIDELVARQVPNAEATFDGGSANTVAGVVELVDEIGQCVLVVHSQGGQLGIDVARRRPGAVAAIAGLEGGSLGVDDHELESVFGSVAFLSVWGDNSEGAAGVNGDERRNGCTDLVDRITASGGTAELLSLPARGIMGNTHLLMMDDNNLDVAELVRGWILASTG